MIIVGLGNPGTQYTNTKHNVGYWIVDRLANQFSMEFKLGKGEYMHTKDSKVSLMKPLSYMNNSGVALKSYIDYFNLNLEDILIVYDDVDLPLGQIKFKSQGSSGGQKGIDSIIYHLKTDNFLRLKIGISTDDRVEPLKSYVLSPFKTKYKKTLDLVLDNCVEAINFLLNNTLSETMNKYNTKNKGNK
tara:strand:+ start:2204 stop:2767 length:564 start_codon:yes stop_codon:yes gene_type:complete